MKGMNVHRQRLWMLCCALAIASLASEAVGQAKAADSANVGPDTPVVTVDGVCGTDPAVAQEASPCRTVLTRSEYDAIAEAGGALTPSTKSQFVQVYVQYLMFGGAAQKRGMDKDPRFQRMLQLSRLQLLTQALMRDLQAKSEQISPEELEKFYRENPGVFEQAAVFRIFAPRTKYVDKANGVQEAIPGTEPEMKTLVEKIHARAVAGEDFQLLEKEVLATSNLRESDETNLGKLTREQLRRSHREVFDLKLGKVSALLEEPEGYYIYKIASRSVPPLESVKNQVKATIQKTRMDAWKKDITEPAKVSLNEQYFGTSAAAKSGPTH
jgi:hypothetical protein